MTSPFPFETERHQDEVPPSSVHPTDYDSLTDPAADPDNNVLAGKRWRRPDSLTAPTKYRIYRRNVGNTAWILEGSWGIAAYAVGQIPAADVDGYLWPADVGGIESGDSGIFGSGTAGKLAKFDGAVAIGDSAVTENADDITSEKPLLLPASTTAIASLRLPHGAAPTSPVNGDVWSTSAGIFVRINGVTIGPLGTGGGGGAEWEAVFDYDGTDFSEFTSGSGSWASASSVIKQTTDSGERYAKRTVQVPHGQPLIFEAEVQMVSTPANQDRVGLFVGCGGGDFGGAALSYLEWQTGGTRVTTDKATNSNRAITDGFAWGNNDEWHKIRMLVTGQVVSVYVDEVLVHSANNTVDVQSGGGRFVGLYTNATEGWFRNIKCWTLTGGMPA